MGFLAAATSTVRVGSLVASISARTIAQLARSMATLDVLSGGRIVCGVGAGWFEEEAKAVGAPMPPRAERFRLLDDGVQALAAFFAKGGPTFDGRSVHIPAASAYPRPLQDPMPILVGGGGDRTLTIAAQRGAAAVNLQGAAGAVRGRVEFLHERLLQAGRAPSSVEVTHLGPILIGLDHDEVVERVEQARGRVAVERFRSSVNAGTVEQQLDRLRALRQVGVDTVIVSLVDLQGPDDVRRLRPLIDAVAQGR
jgi:alkanesulfonate monooxygenase SsuD/methylene tetrahydromethanopterin reductase-like flavin-dependent oxidoreductase (luciferase family)